MKSSVTAYDSSNNQPLTTSLSSFLTSSSTKGFAMQGSDGVVFWDDANGMKCWAWSQILNLKGKYKGKRDILEAFVSILLQ